MKIKVQKINGGQQSGKPLESYENVIDQNKENRKMCLNQRIYEGKKRVPNMCYVAHGKTCVIKTWHQMDICHWPSVTL